MRRLFAAFVSFLPRLWSNWITLLGTSVTTLSGLAILGALAVDVFAAGAGLNVYASTILYLVLPGIFIGGLFLIPLGLLWERRARSRRGEGTLEADPLQETFRKALESPVVRRRILFVGAATFLNILIFATVAHQAVSFMDSPRFCGTVCHSVMEPEWNAYLRSPHSRVACVECHIGEGASWFVKAKLSGLRQVYGVIAGDFHRPIKTPVHNLRPARDTCEHCHWPAKFAGNRVAFRTRYLDDEANTPAVTALLLKVGGENPRTGLHEGIHWHVSRRYQVRYEALDEQRQQIGRVQKVVDGKVVAEWTSPAGRGAKPREVRAMDCVDCHNRPTHIYDGSPAHAVDLGFTEGLLDRATPFLHEVALAVLKDAQPPRAAAQAHFRRALEETYRRAHPDRVPDAARLDAAARGIAALYLRNVYPAMRVTWGTYTSHIGHGGPELTRSGCLRCHAGDHTSAGGETLVSDCDACHEILAQDEPPEKLPEAYRHLLHLP